MSALIPLAYVPAIISAAVYTVQRTFRIAAKPGISAVPRIVTILLPWALSLYERSIVSDLA